MRSQVDMYGKSTVSRGRKCKEPEQEYWHV